MLGSSRGAIKMEVSFVKPMEIRVEYQFGEPAEKPFLYPNFLPPSENVIQGIAKPELKPKPSAALTVKGTDGRTRVRTGFSRGRFVKRFNRERNNVENQVKREDDGNSLCRFCDFHDKEYGYCLIKRLNGKEAACLYNPLDRNRNPSKNNQKPDGWVRTNLQKEGGEF